MAGRGDEVLDPSVRVAVDRAGGRPAENGEFSRPPKAWAWFASAAGAALVFSRVEIIATRAARVLAVQTGVGTRAVLLDQRRETVSGASDNALIITVGPLNSAQEQGTWTDEDLSAPI